MAGKKKKVRVELRKNRSKPPRENDLTKSFRDDAAGTEDARSGERVRAKGDISRRRTIVQESSAAGDAAMPAVDASACIRGRVLRVHGLASVVEADDGRIFRCAIRRMLKSLSTDERSVVTTGDVVWLLPAAVDSGQWPVDSQIEGSNALATFQPLCPSLRAIVRANANTPMAGRTA